MVEPRTKLDTSICTLLDFVDLNPIDIARFFDVELAYVSRAIPRLVESGHLMHSPTEVFAFRNNGYWNPDAPSIDGEPVGPVSPKRRHDDYLDPSSPFFHDPDEWQIANGAPAGRSSA